MEDRSVLTGVQNIHGGDADVFGRLEPVGTPGVVVAVHAERPGVAHGQLQT